MRGSHLWMQRFSKCSLPASTQAQRRGRSRAQREGRQAGCQQRRRCEWYSLRGQHSAEVSASWLAGLSPEHLRSRLSLGYVAESVVNRDNDCLRSHPCVAGKLRVYSCALAWGDDQWQPKGEYPNTAKRFDHVHSQAARDFGMLVNPA